jgi:hypothetical protein
VLFQFGHDAESGHSVYAKDFLLSAMVDRAPPIVKPTPSAGKVLDVLNKRDFIQLHVFSQFY